MWEDLIGDYNQQVSESRIQIVFPDILERLKAQGPRRFLDYGCGPGFFLRDFTARLNVEQVGYDIEAEMIVAALQNCKSCAQTSIVKKLEDYTDGYFDAISNIAVWMCWKSDTDCVKNLSTMRRLLQPEGRLFSVVTHPAFHDQAYSTFSLHLDSANYLLGGSPYEVRIQDQGKTISFTDYHWPFSAMSSQLKRAGFQIEDIHEYADTTPVTRGSPWMLIVAAPRS